MSTTTVTSKKDLTTSLVHLAVGQTSGTLPLSIPFPADYIMVLNNTEATIAVCVGERSDQSADAQIWTPGDFISLPLIETTQKLTVFWTSDQPIAANNNLVQFYFSNVTIPLQGGNFGAAGASQDVNVMNEITAQFASAQDVNVKSMPIVAGTDGSGPKLLSTDSSGRLNVNMVSGTFTVQDLTVNNVSAATTTTQFQNAQTAANNGTAFPVGAYKTLTVEITGTSTGHTISFIGEGPSGHPIPIMGTNLSTMQNATSTSGLNELWQFDVTGITNVLMEVTAVNNSNLTVNGTAVA